MRSEAVTEINKYYFNRAYGRRILESTQHYHDTYEIYFLKEGKCNYFIGERSYEVVSGDLVLIPEGIIHRTMYGEQSRCRFLINFPRELLSEEISSQLLMIDNLYRNPELAGKIEEIFLKIENEYQLSDTLSAEALRCYISELVLLVIRNSTDRKAVVGGTPYIEKAVKYMQENYMNPVKLSEIARLASVSPEHFSRTFKRETGFGFNEFLTLIRLQRAEYMLKNEPGKSIGEIAFACGFNDSNYFSHKFKESYGYSPSRAR